MYDAKILPIIMAAGKGTRMKSDLPKVMHKVAGLTMLEHVARRLSTAFGKKGCFIVSEEVKNSGSHILDQFSGYAVIEQVEKKGTADAVGCAGAVIEGVRIPPYAKPRVLSGQTQPADLVLVCNGDCPGFDPTLLREFVDFFISEDAALGVLGMELPNPKGYGRLDLDTNGRLIRIIEEKDANDVERTITLCNSGIIVAKSQVLFELLSKVTSNNTQGEFYLTDCISAAVEAGIQPIVFKTEDWQSLVGVNDLWQLAETEKLIVSARMRQLAAEGIRFIAPETSYIDWDIRVGQGSVIGPGCTLKGKTSIGARCILDGQSYLEDAELMDGVQIGAGSILKGSRVQTGERLPPSTVRC